MVSIPPEYVWNGWNSFGEPFSGTDIVCIRIQGVWRYSNFPFPTKTQASLSLTSVGLGGGGRSGLHGHSHL
jgi:hypothetical protein